MGTHATFWNLTVLLLIGLSLDGRVCCPSHEDWSGLFDLKKNPFETNNLVNLPASVNLLARLRAEFLKEQQRAAK
jgi:hypothetical protein